MSNLPPATHPQNQNQNQAQPMMVPVVIMVVLTQLVQPNSDPEVHQHIDREALPDALEEMRTIISRCASILHPYGIDIGLYSAMYTVLLDPEAFDYLSNGIVEMKQSVRDIAKFLGYFRVVMDGLATTRSLSDGNQARFEDLERLLSDVKEDTVRMKERLVELDSREE